MGRALPFAGHDKADVRDPQGAVRLPLAGPPVRQERVLVSGRTRGQVGRVAVGRGVDNFVARFRLVLPPIMHPKKNTSQTRSPSQGMG